MKIEISTIKEIDFERIIITPCKDKESINIELYVRRDPAELAVPELKQYSEMQIKNEHYYEFLRWLTKQCDNHEKELRNE